MARLGGRGGWFLRTIARSTCARTIRWCAIFEGRERRDAAVARVCAADSSTWDAALPELLACGGELKNIFCLTKGTHAILSQHIGDLENYETLVFFEETLGNLQEAFRVAPRAVAHDLHPGYLSTKYALGWRGCTTIGVQHHHAHIASCMAENGLDGEVIGVAFDGTGYGDGRRDLGRRVSGGGLRRVRAARPLAIRAAGGRRRGGAGAVAGGAGLCGRGGATGYVRSRKRESARCGG